MRHITPDFLSRLSTTDLIALGAIMRWQQQDARDKQLSPPGNWHTWLIMAGRGWGKTRTGAEWAWQESWAWPGTITHVVSRTAEDHEKVTFDGPSGLLRVIPPQLIAHKTMSPYYIKLVNGSEILSFSAEQPESLRGPQCHRTWADELGAWKYPDEAFDQINLSTRLPLAKSGEPNRTLITTTPKPNRVIKNLVKDSKDEAGGVIITSGATYENQANLSKNFIKTLERRYRGTRLERQELFAQLLLDTPGALWTLETLLKSQVREAPQNLIKVGVGVDPAISTGENSNETGIIVAALGEGGHGYVLGDFSGVYPPGGDGNEEGWGEKAVIAYDRFSADEIVIEVNQGGDMAARTIELAARALYRNGKRSSPHVHIVKVHATRGKEIRAQPISALYSQGMIHHVESAQLERLEDQMTSFIPGTDRKKTDSPDRLDALVWVLTRMMLGGHPTTSALDTLASAMTELSRPSSWNIENARH